MTSERGRAARRALALGLVVSALAFFSLFLVVDATATATALAAIDPIWLLPASGFVLVGWWAQARRWAAALPDRPKIGTWRLMRMIVIGLFGNLILPLRGGDLVRIGLAARALGGQSGRALASVAVDRAMDLVTLLALAAIAALFAPLPDGWFGALVTVAFAMLGAALVALGIAAWPDVGHRLVATLAPSFLRDRLSLLLSQLAEGLREVARPSRAVRVVGWSAAQWSLHGAAIWCCIVAFEPTIGVSVAPLFMVATGLGTALPAAPSGAGVYHAAGVMALAPLGIDPERAMAIAVIAHLHSVVLQLGTGALAAAFEGGASGMFGPPVTSEGA